MNKANISLNTRTLDSFDLDIMRHRLSNALAKSNDKAILANALFINLLPIRECLIFSRTFICNLERNSRERLAGCYIVVGLCSSDRTHEHVREARLWCTAEPQFKLGEISDRVWVHDRESGKYPFTYFKHFSGI